MSNDKDLILVKVQFDKKNEGTLVLNNYVDRVKELMNEKVHRRSILSYKLYKYVHDKYEPIEDEKEEASI